MATTKFNGNILAAARRLKDERSDPTSVGDTGRRFKSALLTEYQNRAIRELLREMYEKYGPKVFPELFPEYVKTSATLGLVAGTVAKPVDGWYFLSLDKADYTLHYEKLEQQDVALVRAGKKPLVKPTTSRPIFFEEGKSLFVLPNVAGVNDQSVVGRYIRTHQDISPLTASVGAGNWNTAGGSWTAATKELTATMNVGFATSDVNKKLMFRSSTTVYFGRIASRVATNKVIVEGDGLPTSDITSPNVLQVMVSDTDPDGTDLLLNENWYDEIVDRMVAMGERDAYVGRV